MSGQSITVTFTAEAAGHGAQYFIGKSADHDIIVVFAEAFERDANPDDFRLEALIAHECGHQRLLRVKNLHEVLAKFLLEIEERRVRYR